MQTDPPLNPAEAAMEMIHAGFAALAESDLSSLPTRRQLALLDEYEVVARQLPSHGHRMLATLQADTSAVELGAKNWRQVLATRLRISTTDAARRLSAAAELAPRHQITGPPLPPLLPAVAAAQGAGLINNEHVKTLRDTMHDLPQWVDARTRSQIEVELVRLAVTVGPRQLELEAARRLFLLDQDGPEPDDTDRARKRGISMGRQGRDGMSKVTGWLTPEMRATWEAIFAKFAAPGMCNPDNPDDVAPCTSGTPSQAQIDGDHRSHSQRQHDAMLVIGRIALSTDLGQLNGLPVQIIVRTTLADLESRAGVGTTGGGSMLPISEVIRMGAHAHWALGVFDGATGSAMNLFRTKRFATPAQRLMLIARDGGCTKPDCPVGAYGCQVHHADADWIAGGNTNVDDMALACPADNRLVGPAPNQWTTDVINGETHWIPPEALDTGQARINHLHRPEHLTLGDDTGPPSLEKQPPRIASPPIESPLAPWFFELDDESDREPYETRDDIAPFDSWVDHAFERGYAVARPRLPR